MEKQTQPQAQASSEKEKEKQKAPVAEIYAVGQKPDTAPIRGYDFNQGVDYKKLLQSYATTGLQATNLATAIDLLNQAIAWRLSDEPLTGNEAEEQKDPKYRQSVRCTMWLGYTANMASCGMRDIVRYLAQHKMVDCIVTSGGGIEEDIMKCMSDFYLGDFNMDDTQNRKNLNCRIGNILVPAENYIKLEAFLTKTFAEMVKEQNKDKIVWTPSTMIRRLGKEINHPDSIYYWCYKNDIPVFCPGITDGAIGDMLFSCSEDLVLDVVQDVKEINRMAIRAKKSCVTIIGGSVPKHHILNAHIWRNGADFGVFINTGLFEDGSDSGAKISEAITWGKLRLNSKSTKIFGEASIIFPLLVAETFAKDPKAASKLP